MKIRETKDMQVGGELTIRCPFCGSLYKFYSHYVGDQSACPECRDKAKPKWK